MKTIAVALGLLTLGGCISTSTLYVGPDGKMGRCAASGGGVTGMTAAAISARNCAVDMEKMGYRLYVGPEEMGVKLSSEFPITIASIGAANKSNANLKVGDRIESVWGRTPTDLANAIWLMSGGTGSSYSMQLTRSGESRTVNITLP